MGLKVAFYPIFRTFEPWYLATWAQNQKKIGTQPPKLVNAV